MLVYRITLKQFSTELFAPGIAGRWNGAGRKVLYSAESIALAFLENMVRRQGVGFNNDFKTMIIEIPDELKILELHARELPPEWRSINNYSKCQPFGNKWFDENIYPVLKVPSAVLPDTFNYVINTMHADYKKVRLLAVTELVPDERIEDLLKRI